MAADVIEAVDSVSPSQGVLSLADGAKADWTFYLNLSASEDFREKTAEVLGDVSPKGDGRLSRRPPRAHPQLEWMWASSLAFQGVGLRSADGAVRARRTASLAAASTPAITDNFCLHPSYDLHVRFEQVGYSVLADDEIDVLPGQWYDDDSAPRSFLYANEWLRWVDAPRLPANEFLQFRQGAMRFRTGSGDPPGEYPFPGLVRIPMPKEVMRLTWYAVPASYFEHRNSYLSRFLWRVNQNPVYLGGTDWEPGELLLMGWSFPRRVTPPFPQADVVVPGGFSTQKVVDITIDIGVCRFTTDDPPEPINRNHVTAGHNLAPWAGDRKFYYPTTDRGESSDSLAEVPFYFSCPMELLFTDPSVAQPDLGLLR